MPRNLLTGKELMLVLKLRVREQQSRGWKKRFRNMNEGLELPESRFILIFSYYSFNGSLALC